MARVGFVSLGCAKNLVDSEVMLGLLSSHGHEISSSEEDAEVIVVNTCGFIDKAKEESIQTILEMVELKNQGSCKRLVVAGCLVERYREQIQQEIPQVDAVVGTNELPSILAACDVSETPPTYEDRELYLYSDSDPRLLTTPGYSAYIKIAEGCDHPCTFCVIPQIRGKFRSRRPDSILREAEALTAQGVEEVNLVAQDSTMYGWDQGDRRGLADLLRRLNRVEGLRWIRFLYAYPNSIYPELLQAVAECENVCKYIDMPLQSASREVLRRMKRGGNRGSLTRLIERIRGEIPDVALRTTFIVGFPGETDQDFQEVLEFVREIEFDRLGVFTYSDEESSESVNLERKIPEEVKAERLQRVMELQAGISGRKNAALVGRKLPVLLEGPSEETELLWQGRMPSQAPGIDGCVYINDGITETSRRGQFGRVSITEAHDYDLVGTFHPE